MTLTPEQIREAVELAEGFEIRLWHDNGLRLILPGDDYGSTTVVCGDTFQNAPKWWFAALASQLKRQVDESDGWNNVVIEYLMETIVLSKGKVVARWPKDSPQDTTLTREENSILVCTEFLRGRK